MSDADEAQRTQHVTWTGYALAMLTRRVVFWTLGIAVCGVLLYPFESTVTNAWLITATNTDGHPLAGCRIEQHWEWKAIGLDRSDAATTDGSGHVMFPRRTVRANLAERVTGIVATFNFHSAPTARRVEFYGCDAKNQRTLLGISQAGPTMMYTHQVSTVWRDAVMLK
jgi:hypothetical protein